MKRRYFFLLVMSVSFGLYAESIQNVPFKQVLSAEHTPPTQTLLYGDSDQNIIEMWLPPTPSSATVVFIHGGCWMSEYDFGHARAAASALSVQGYRVFSVEYRRTGATGGGWPTTMQDIDAAMTFLQDQGHINAKHSIIAGHSAGGHLALLYAQRNPERIAGVVGLAPITDLERYAEGESGCQRAAVAFMQGTPAEQKKAYLQADPKNYPLHPNTWLLFGKSDKIVGAQQQQTFSSSAKAQVVSVDGAGHFDFIFPGSQAWFHLSEVLDKVNNP
ncbi:alpha/beta hydrolase [Alteromonas sediminis]|uniref:Alpha/beta hydrolase n=1 Tax=Alteromonas sediminis TaxID=2259342 RepID=A0A3N5XYB7_9ALTE|nr:alpha/beta hydrolase [Alteromonas sediminis]RPJ65952.1 alpha/beta hydrolase [Alteromonas sediminis]